MPAFNSISPDKLARLIGTSAAPTIIDVRPDGEGLIPGARRLAADDVAQWSDTIPRGPAVVVCVRGEEKGAGVAAWLRHKGIDAEVLEGGFDGWTSANRPVVDQSRVPLRNAEGRTVWVTRARPKVDRIACPWLIRRFIDPDAIFLFVVPSEVAGVAERFDATPFDVENVFWSHRGDLCTFDVMVEEFGLSALAPLQQLATIVRGADTARPDIAPQAAGLLAMSLGLSRMYADDLQQLEAGMLFYDALYRWCRDAVDETHDWVSHTPKSGSRP